jgi:hypothetical protein
MGLAEYIKLGVSLKRESISLQTDSVGSGSIELGSAYVLLNITNTVPCRLRLYDNQSSRDNAVEKNRVFGNTNISAETALIGDFSMSNATTHTVDPVLYSVVQNPSSKLTYYKIDGVTSPPYPTITFNRYLLENPDISAASRMTLPTIQHNLSAGSRASGSLVDSSIPQTYLLVSASVSGSDVRARVRLYSTSASLYNATEITRPFATESNATSYLIVDAILSGSETTYFVPKIIGANLQNMGTNLNLTRIDRTKMVGEHEIYYVIENMATAGTANISASIHVFSLEN